VETALKYAPEEPQMKVILAEVAAIIGKNNPKTVAKALSRAVDDIWEHGDREKLEEIYGRANPERPAPKELVYRLAEYVRGGLEYALCSDPQSGEYGILGLDCATGDYAALYPCTLNYTGIMQLIHHLNQVQTPLSSFMETFLRSDILRPPGYSEQDFFYNVSTGPKLRDLERILGINPTTK